MINIEVNPKLSEFFANYFLNDLVILLFSIVVYHSNFIVIVIIIDQDYANDK